jgi:hypothetical protein
VKALSLRPLPFVGKKSPAPEQVLPDSWRLKVVLPLRLLALERTSDGAVMADAARQPQTLRVSAGVLELL